MEKNIQKISIWRICTYFIIYSFVGYVIETLFALINYNVLESRKSFLYGPFCGIYGVGAVVLILALRYFNKNNYRLFFGGCLVGAIVEYIISFLGEVLFDARWWDYSDRFLNINGRICLLYSLFWGILSLMLIRIINPQVDRFINYIKKNMSLKTLKIYVVSGTVFMICNAIASATAMNVFLIRMSVENDLNVKNKEQVIKQYIKIYSNEDRTKFIHGFWGNEKMIKTYPNVTIKTVDGGVVYVKDLLPEIKPYYYKFNE